MSFDIKKIDWKKCNGLIPAIIQNIDTRQVLMLGFMNEEALQKTIEDKKVTFFSRTKNRIWQKGETSKDYLYLKDIFLDCDNDSLLVYVKPENNTCHLGRVSCFSEKKDTNIVWIEKLEAIIKSRKNNLKDKDSYVSSLFVSGINKIAQKVGEEAVETVIATINEGEKEFLNETADLLFHLMILLEEKNVKLDSVVDILMKRHEKLEANKN